MKKKVKIDTPPCSKGQGKLREEQKSPKKNILKKDYKKEPKNVLWNAAGFSNRDSIVAMGRKNGEKKRKRN